MLLIGFSLLFPLVDSMPARRCLCPSGFIRPSNNANNAVSPASPSANGGVDVW